MMAVSGSTSTMFTARLQIALSGRRTLLIASCGWTGACCLIRIAIVSMNMSRADKEAALRVIAREKVCQT